MFFESKLSVNQVAKANPYARDLAYGEVVFAGGFVGTVADYDGIAQSASGNIDINPDRLIQTSQVDAADLPAVGDKVYLLEGTTAAGVLQASAGAGTVYVGICTIVDATSGSEWIEFKPAYQDGDRALAGA